MLRHSTRVPQQGLSLVEMMIAITLGTIVLGIVVSVFWNTLQSNNKTLRAARLVQELRAVTDYMVRDLRRAGHWELSGFATRPYADIDVSGSNATIVSAGTGFSDWYLGPDSVSPVGLSIVGENGRATITSYAGGASVAINTTKSFARNPLSAGAWTLHSYASDWFPIIDVLPECVLYRLDQNGDVNVDADERFGFRLNGGAIERFVDGTHECGSGNWSPISDPSVVTIVSLAFSTPGSKTVDDGGSSRLYIREIDISITAELAVDPFVTRTLQTTVRPRADRYDVP